MGLLMEAYEPGLGDIWNPTPLNISIPHPDKEMTQVDNPRYANRNFENSPNLK